MERDPLIVAARTLALLWYTRKHPGAFIGQASAWARENYVGFLADATDVLGRAFMGHDLSTDEKEQAAADLMRAKESYREI